MTDDEPKPFFDRSWWQQCTSNALGSAVGTGIVALVGLFAAITSGIVQLPQGPSPLFGIVFTVVVAGMFAFVAFASFYSARVRPERKRYHVLMGTAFVVLGTIITVTQIAQALTQHPYR
ncbi:hypothetical protein [Amnibacterium kyonggiense]|uniref:Uncharacterized protein n=1 Tax=Amnibacterium kyonggiense TaxID=595671 RepID=A0A4R7FEY4_9MICO|nr:hypothetical protein [Amnibacterium kyonggiense]TDS74505.1 hypothetical protein CLV52_3688 [Amnibacterium kyonggiense]